MDLKGKNAIITGAAKRLGREVALTLATAGMNVAVHYHNSKAEASELADQIGKMGRKAIAVKADCKKRKQIYSAVGEAQKELGKIDLLINNAAIFGPSKLSEIDDKEWDKYLDINLKAPFYFAQKFSEVCASNAKIINIADTYGESPAANFIPYGVSKGGIIHLTKGLAKALAPNILVNCVCPGVVEMGERASHPQGASHPCEGRDLVNPSTLDSCLRRNDMQGSRNDMQGRGNDIQARAVEATLLKKAGSPEDIVKTVLFLAENDYIPGQSIFVDGGHTI